MSSATTSPTSRPSFSISTSANPAKHPEMAIRRASQTNYMDAQRAAAAASAQAQSPIDIPDGRRNSQGEALKSPIATWKPTFERTQSWNRQDLKREVQKGELEKGSESAGFSES